LFSNALSKADAGRQGALEKEKELFKESVDAYGCCFFFDNPLMPLLYFPNNNALFLRHIFFLRFATRCVKLPGLE